MPIQISGNLEKIQFKRSKSSQQDTKDGAMSTYAQACYASSSKPCNGEENGLEDGEVQKNKKVENLSKEKKL